MFPVMRCGKHMPTEGHPGDSEPSQNNASSATESSPKILLAMGNPVRARECLMLYMT